MVMTARSLAQELTPPPPANTPPRTPSSQTPSQNIRTTLTSLLSDSSLCDVHLVSSEGTSHPAVRALLAARSPVFRNMLFGTFAEARQQNVSLPISSITLLNVLQFLYTDHCPALSAVPKPNKYSPGPPFDPAFQFTSPCVHSAHHHHHPSATSSWSSLFTRPTTNPVPDYLPPDAPYPAQPPHASSPRQPHAASPRRLVTTRKRPRSEFDATTTRHTALGTDVDVDKCNPALLADLLVAADYLDIQPLVDTVNAAIRNLLVVAPIPACTILQIVPPCLSAYNDALVAIRREPVLALGIHDSKGIGSARAAVARLGADRMATILGDKDIFTSDAHLFNVLLFWASSGVDEESRYDKARELGRLVDLERIKPSFLRDVVRPCGLVEEKRLQETFEQQALEAERGRALYDNFRGGSVFSNGSKCVRASDFGFRNHTLGPWLSGGRHEWTFRINSNSDWLWIGLSSVPPGHGSPFFAHACGWAYSTKGLVTPSPRNGHSGSGKLPPRADGSCSVKMVLNLVKSGTMSVIVLDGTRETFTAFQGLKSHASRFIAAVCMNAPAKLQLIEERHHLS